MVLCDIFKDIRREDKMNFIYKTFGKISLLLYVLVLYQLWHMCQYGGLQNHLPMLVIGVLALTVTLLLWFISKRYRQEDVSKDSRRTTLFRMEIIFFILVTLYSGGHVIYSAIPYNGALSWKIDEWLRKKEIKLVHNNFFKDGVKGVLLDLDEAMDLPDELYIVNKYQMTFDENGTIQNIYTFLYGKDEKGETKTYLVDYNAEKNEKMSVWVDGTANTNYDGNMRLAPMLTILEQANCKRAVTEWAQNNKQGPYEILYRGSRSFQTEDGLVYLSGDVDGDGAVNGETIFSKLGFGGEVVGFEVSLHVPSSEEIMPIRYIMEPKYISPEELAAERQKEQTEEAKNTEGWTIDKSDESMYFFLNDEKGWRLVVIDAAAGSRFYVMEKTENGGSTWNRINSDPFAGTIGVTQGLIFIDNNIGFALLAGASQSHAQLYVTKDGGVTFEKIQLPMNNVTQLPESTDEYDYMHMPKKEDSLLEIKVTTEATESNGILFQSNDNGLTWEYKGITQ